MKNIERRLSRAERPSETRKLRPGSIEHLVCISLGYCCLFAFFSFFKRTGQIAARLGISDRAVRYKKEEFKCGKIKCRNRPKCMKEFLTD